MEGGWGKGGGRGDPGGFVAGVVVDVDSAIVVGDAYLRLLVCAFLLLFCCKWS